MTATDPEGNVELVCCFFSTLDPLNDITTQHYQSPATASVGALADTIASANGIATGAVSLMSLTTTGVLPAIDARATLLSASVLTNGGAVILVPGS